jgi:hypothetical protein
MYLTCKIKLKTRESAKSNSTHAKLINSHAKPEKKKTREPAKSDSTHVKSIKINIIKNHDFVTNFTSLMEL